MTARGRREGDKRGRRDGTREAVETTQEKEERWDKRGRRDRTREGGETGQQREERRDSEEEEGTGQKRQEIRDKRGRGDIERDLRRDKRGMTDRTVIGRRDGTREAVKTEQREGGETGQERQ
ncbi:hypothetical protein PoB_001518900 [Plakobranchus ocellatus]|uniref:Uncharacterized protein n=1 Tax=Plakobranchus ocellatus TaxID=259542 RepID=A0AAV3Z2S2_9GAST|nr:hypothetical protein PoB_001518900 [Plakobranchus ocellatus]